MNRLLAQTRLLIVAAVCMLFPAMVSHGQSEAEAGSGLMMENMQQAEKSVVIPTGCHLKVTTYEGDAYKVYKGQLTAVTDSSLMIENEELPFRKLQRIGVTRVKGGTSLGGKAGVIAGLIGMGVSFLMGLLSVAFLANSGGCSQIAAAFFLLILAFLLGITSIIFIIVGLAFYGAGNTVARAFRLDAGKWKVRRNG